MDRLGHDAITFALAGSGYALERKDWGVLPEKGELCKQGLDATTYYFRKNWEYFQNNCTPDLFFKDDVRSIFITVEITTNPEKKKLIEQLNFFLSDEYRKKVINKKNHEVWLVVTAGIYDEVIKRIKGSNIKDKESLLIFTIAYDDKKQKYALKRMDGKHTKELSNLQDLIPLDIPMTFPWMSVNLSLPSVLFAMGGDYFRQITNQPKPTQLLEVYKARNDIPLQYKTFKKYMEKLAILVPELIELDKMEVLTIKQGNSKTIMQKLNKIRNSTKGELEQKIKEELTKRKKKKTSPTIRKKKIKSYKHKDQKKLF